MNTTTDQQGPSNRTIYAIIGLLVAVLLLAAGAYLFVSGNQPAALTVGGPFSLIDGDGHPVTDQTWRGKYMLVYFGYTFCPDVCPTTLSNVADALYIEPIAALGLKPEGVITLEHALKRAIEEIVKRIYLRGEVG